MSSKLHHNWINQDASQTILFISGWGIDHHIFPIETSEYNVLTVSYDDPYSHEDILDLIQKYAIKNVTLIGFSMGAYIAHNLVKEKIISPQQTLLIGAKPAYNSKNIAMIKKLLLRNKDAFMRSFYKDCFHSTTEWLYFKKHILPKTAMSTDILLNQLSYLEEQKLKADTSTSYQFIHGENDKVAPFEHIKQLSPSIIRIENCGHVPFLHENWPTIFETIIK
jgi:pimeloyl-ACP methyl ester carboxylesterase